MKIEINKKYTIPANTPLSHTLLDNPEAQKQFLDLAVEIKKDAYAQGAKDKVEEVRGEIGGEIVKLAEPDEKQFGAGDLNTHLDVIYNIIFKR
jgi:hypothetical protein